MYIIYILMLVCRAISNSTTPQPQHFFGSRPLASDEKKMPRFRGYAVEPSKTQYAHYMYCF